MAYNTRYHLNWNQDGPEIQEVAEAIGQADPGSGTSGMDQQGATRHWQSIITGDNRTSWYNHEQNMAEASRNWPSLLFTLDGQGEEDDDIWRKYFRNGLVQEARAVVTYPAFNPELLRDPMERT